MKAEDTERREARKPNDTVVVKAKDAEHREAKEPIKKAEEAEHTGDTRVMITSHSTRSVFPLSCFQLNLEL